MCGGDFVSSRREEKGDRPKGGRNTKSGVLKGWKKKTKKKRVANLVAGIGDRRDNERGKREVKTDAPLVWYCRLSQRQNQKDV